MEENIRQLLEALHNDPKVRELAKDIKRPETDEAGRPVWRKNV